jgi:hypothetical protein
MDSLDDLDDLTPADLDDVTPTDNPGSAVRRFTSDLRELCQGFDHLSPLLDEAPRDDRPFLLSQFANLANEIERTARELREAMTAQLELETVFRPRKDRP